MDEDFNLLILMFRGVQYVLSMMRKCIMVKVGEAKREKELK